MKERGGERERGNLIKQGERREKGGRMRQRRSYLPYRIKILRPPATAPSEGIEQGPRSLTNGQQGGGKKRKNGEKNQAERRKG